MLYINQNLLIYTGRSQKYTGIVINVTNTFIVVKDIIALGNTGIALKIQRFNVGNALSQYIKFYEVDKNNIVEFYASVYFKEYQDLKEYGLNRMRQIETLGVVHV